MKLLMESYNKSRREEVDVKPGDIHHYEGFDEVIIFFALGLDYPIRLIAIDGKDIGEMDYIELSQKLAPYKGAKYPTLKDLRQRKAEQETNTDK